MTSHVLVTGAAGFLGRAVAQHLVTNHCSLTTATLDFRPHEVPGARSICCDINEPGALIEAMKGCDIVCHLGGVGDVDLATREPRRAVMANVMGTTNVALAAAELGAHVIYASTWEVYGRQSASQVDESNPCHPEHVYSASKLSGEEILRSICAMRGLSATILRLGTAYGPGLRENSVFMRFIAAGRQGTPLVVHGGGGQTRQFTHSEDIARAFVAAFEQAGTGGLYNIVSPESVSILALADMISRHFGVPIEVGKERAGDPPVIRVSGQLARDCLQWIPQVTFREGLSELLTLSPVPSPLA